MFVAKFNRGGSVYLSPALRYMAQNPDVFNASIANAEARGLQGLARQAQIERDAELHYAFHGQPEGRAYGGRTFLGGLLTPRLGDTFGLSPERREELIQERDAPTGSTGMVTPPPTNNELVPLVPIVDHSGENFAEGGEVMSEEAQRQRFEDLRKAAARMSAERQQQAAADALNEYQSSSVVQGYLRANPDVLASATRIAQSQGVAPGSEFQRVVENAAREHYRDFGVREGRKIAGFPETGSILLLDEVRRLPAPVATTTEPEGIASVQIDPRMRAFATILANTYDMDDPGTQGGLRPEFFSGANTVSDIYDLVGDINVNLRDRLIDRNYGDTNEDKLPGRVDEIIRYAYNPNTSGETMFGVAGGTEGLLRAYDELGITGAGDTYADRGARGIMNILSPTDRSSINMDGTGGSEEISEGGEYGTGYKTFADAYKDAPRAIRQAIVPTPIGAIPMGMKIFSGTVNENPYETYRQEMRNLQFSSPGNPEPNVSPSFTGLGATSF